MSGGLNCTDIPCTDRPSQLATFSAITQGRRAPTSSSSPAPAGWIIGRYRRRGRSPFQGSAGGTSTLKPQANLRNPNHKPQANLRNPNHKPHGIFSQTNCQHVPAECLVVRRVRVGPRHTAAEAGPGTPERRCPPPAADVHLLLRPRRSRVRRHARRGHQQLPATGVAVALLRRPCHRPRRFNGTRRRRGGAQEEPDEEQRETRTVAHQPVSGHCLPTRVLAPAMDSPRR